MSGVVVNQLKLSLTPWLRLNFPTLSRIHTHAYISPLVQNHILQILPYHCTLKPLMLSNSVVTRNFSTEKKSENVDITSNKSDCDSSHPQPETKVSQKTKLKQAVRDYGATIVVFHVAISLASLGICYLAISNGVDAVRLLTFIGFSESVISSKVAVGGSTFVIAYAVHKCFAPVRIGITLSVAPFIVRYLRRINWLKSPVKKE